jgi:hypothetical protein
VQEPANAAAKSGVFVTVATVDVVKILRGSTPSSTLRIRQLLVDGDTALAAGKTYVLLITPFHFTTAQYNGEWVLTGAVGKYTVDGRLDCGRTVGSHMHPVNPLLEAAGLVRRTAAPWRVFRGAAMCAISLACAGAMLAGMAACGQTGNSGDRGQASCVAPFIRADPRRSPPDPGHPATFGHVRPGQRISVYGWWYYGGPCADSPTADRSISPRISGGSVQLTLTTADHRTATLATVRPEGADASFVATVAVPAEATPGPASISDGHGDVINLDIVPH